MEKNFKRISSLLFIVVVVITLSVFALPKLVDNIKYGLDLQGGFEVLYKVEDINGGEVTSDMVTNTYKTIQKRIDVLGVSEPEITIEGKNIRVQLAGIDDKEEARDVLSSVANLTFRDSSDNLLMGSDVLKSGGASLGQDSKGGPAVSLQIDDKKLFYEVTEDLSKTDDKLMVIWLDYEEGDSYADEVLKKEKKYLSAATVSQGFNSDVIIQGNFTTEEVQNLVELINSGSLPTKLTEISSRTVNASFGENALNKTFFAGIVGILIIIALMILKYGFSGFIASAGLVVYTLLVFLVFWLIGGVLTLPGIAAVILGIGMAVDANVINFARIRDELKAGKSFKSAYKSGNSHSLGTIVDANITTLIVAIILFIFGESSVKGFATMLIISILTTLFVMVFLARFVLNKFVETGYFDDKLGFLLGYNEKKMKNKKSRKFSVTKNVRIFFALAIVLIIAGITSLSTKGLNLGIEFKGGSSISVTGDVTREQVETELETLEYTIDTIDETGGLITATIDADLSKEEVEAVEKLFVEKYNASSEIGVISNIVKQDLIKNAILALVIAAIGIVIYISIRFKFSYAISAILALLHDTFIVLTIFSLFGVEVSTMFIAALLSIIGYSINDTIVIFNRIKENEDRADIKTKDDLKNVIDDSIRQTFTRTIVTTTTTLIAVLALLILGSYEIFNFNLALLVGLLAGTYSSLVIVGNIYYLFEKKSVGKPKKKKWYEVVEEEEKRIKGINS